MSGVVSLVLAMESAGWQGGWRRDGWAARPRSGGAAPVPQISACERYSMIVAFLM